MAGRFSEKCKVIVSDDSMTASLFIEPPEDGIAYSVEELSAFVKNKGVYAGVIFSELENMTQNNIYYEEHVIAQGTLPEEGSDGYYELFFDDNSKKKPAIRSDGSVDYQSMSEILCVSVGDKLARYHAAELGKNGVDVRGRALRTKPCKDLQQLKGSGFEYNSDTGEYIASVEGRVEYDGKTLKVLNVYEYKGNLDLVVGRIDFRGDVIIKGNISSGTFIRASKSIIVEGNVEAAVLISGGDIILKKGMQGGQKAKISCGGDLYANFIEFTTVDVKGKIEANIIMNCVINAGTDIIISGRKGAIVGGKSYAVGTINAMFLGNGAGLKTLAAVGVTKELYDRERILNTKIAGLKAGIERAKQDKIKVTDNRINRDSKEVQAAKLSQLNRRISKDEKLVSHIESELERIGHTIAVGNHSRIEIGGTVYVGTQIRVNDMVMPIAKELQRVEFVRDEAMEQIAVVQK